MDDLEYTSVVGIARTRAKITGTLALLGAGAGIAAGVAITYLGNVISGYPIKPPLDTYLWHAGLFGMIGASLGPPLVWKSLRSVPLWRALLEPTSAALAGGVLAMLVTPSLFIPLVLGGAGGAIWSLRRRYPGVGESPDEPALIESTPERFS